MTAGLRGSSSGIPGFDLADEVRADVGGLGVDAAAELREQRDERRAESVADDQERDASSHHSRRIARRRREHREHGEEPADAEQRHRDGEQPRHGAAAQRGLERAR